MTLGVQYISSTTHDEQFGGWLDIMLQFRKFDLPVALVREFRVKYTTHCTEDVLSNTYTIVESGLDQSA